MIYTTVYIIDKKNNPTKIWNLLFYKYETFTCSSNKLDLKTVNFIC